MLTSRRRLFRKGYPAAVQTTGSRLLCASVPHCAKELYITPHLLLVHCAWGRFCAAGKRLHLSRCSSKVQQQGAAASWCLLASPQGSWPNELALWLPALPPRALVHPSLPSFQAEPMCTDRTLSCYQACRSKTEHP